MKQTILIQIICLLTTIFSLLACQASNNNLVKKETSSLTQKPLKSQCQSLASKQQDDNAKKNRISVTDKLGQIKSIGKLKINDSARQIISYVGNPETKSENILWGSDGLYHQTWNYPQQGITLEMISETAQSEQNVSSITLSQPSQLKTERNIGIGDSYIKVEFAYKQEKDVDNSITCVRFVAGSIYDGIVFSFHEGRVSQIFLGSAAE